MGLTVEHTLLALIFAIIAALYAAVGQAGGTGYIAVMGLLGFGPDIMKPTALALNIVSCSNWLCALRQGGLANVAELLPIRHPRRPILIAWGRCKSTGVVLPTRCGRLAAVSVCSDDTIRALVH